MRPITEADVLAALLTLDSDAVLRIEETAGLVLAQRRREMPSPADYEVVDPLVPLSTSHPVIVRRVP